MKFLKNINIGLKFKPFIIAELSGNHDQSISRAYRLISLAKKAGADAVKLQTFDPNLLTLNKNTKKFKILDKKNLWKNKTLYQLYKKAQTPYSWHEKLFNKIKQNGMIGFSTPFDEDSVDFLEKLKVPMYKIGSFELNHIPLIKKIAKTKKPIIFSTGMGSLNEIKRALKIIRENGVEKIVVMKCTSKYPAKNSSLNLSTISDLRKKFNVEVGFSDHSLGTVGSVSAVALGATVIEKHLTIKKNDSGIDSKFSADYVEFKNLVSQCKLAWLSRGKIFYGATLEEKDSLKRRRSIFVSKDIKKNEKFNKENIIVIRPSFGLDPKFYFKVLGKKAKKNLKSGIPLLKKDIKNFS